MPPGCHVAIAGPSPDNFGLQRRELGDEKFPLPPLFRNPFFGRGQLEAQLFSLGRGQAVELLLLLLCLLLFLPRRALRRGHGERCCRH